MESEQTGSEGWEISNFGPGVEDSTGGGAGTTDPDLAWEGEEAEGEVVEAGSGGGVSTDWAELPIELWNRRLCGGVVLYSRQREDEVGIAGRESRGATASVTSFSSCI